MFTLIRIVLAEEQRLLREMLIIFLSDVPDLEIVGATAYSNELYEICRSAKPHLLLLSDKMLAADCHKVLQLHQNNIPAFKIVLLTDRLDGVDLMQAIQSGAHAYLLKDLTPTQLITSLRCIHEGMFVMQDSFTQLLRNQISRTPNSSCQNLIPVDTIYAYYNFDDVDRHIINCLVEGKSNKEIGSELNYSEGSIKNRISKILGSTGLKDRTQVAVFALQNNLNETDKS